MKRLGNIPLIMYGKAVAVAVVVSAVNITGNQVVGQTLTVAYTITGAATVVTRRWFRGDTLISTSTSSDTYVLTQADAGNTANITCNVNADGISKATSNSLVQILDLIADTFISTTDIIDPEIISMINFRVLSLKGVDTTFNPLGYNLFAKMPVDYPMVGGTSNTHSYNLVNINTYQLTWFGTWIHSATGSKPNGTNAYAKTGFIFNNVVVPNSAFAVGFYSRTNTNAGGDIGALNDSQGVYIFSRSSLCFCTSFGYPLTLYSEIIFANANSLGYHLVRRNATTVFLDKNGANITSAARGFVTTTSDEIYLGCLNHSGSPNFYSARECATAHIIGALSADESTVLYNITQECNRLLGRQV